MTQSLGEFMDRVKDRTGLDIHFRNDRDDGYLIPKPLANQPTAQQLRDNRYLRDLPISERKHFSNPTFSSGWDIFIDRQFNASSYQTSL